uniref:Kinesin motor domain-containing protein n=1 Tax=Oryza brachyantha TaxID=4533 RepID=J3LB34_ORYBR
MSLRDPSKAAPDPARRRADAVGWLQALFPDLPLPPPPQASDDDLRAPLASGRLLCALLRRLCPGALLDDASTDNVGRVRAAVERMGVSTFSASDLERGQMAAVVNCILALRDRFGSRGGVGDERSPNFLTRCDSEGGRKRMESKLQRMLTSPIMSGEPSTPTGIEPYSPSQVFQLRQGGYDDLPGSKYSDLMKSTSMDNAPTQSLLGVVNSILDESIERKNGQIPYRIACLLRKVIVEIERRISTQAGHIRNQNNLIKAREEKYQSRIRVLEELAVGMEKDMLGDKGQLAEEDMARLMKYQEDVVRLMKENNDLVRLLREKEDMVRLLKEKEDMVRLLKDKESMIDSKAVKVEETQRIEDEDKYRLIKEKDDALVRLVKEKEEMIRLLKEKDDVIRLMKEKDDFRNLENSEVEGGSNSTDDNKDRLIKEKNDIVLRLTKEKEEMVRMLKEKEDLLNLEKVEFDGRSKSTDDNKDRLIKEKNDIVLRLTKEKEEMVRLLKKEDIIRLMKEKEEMVNLEKGEVEGKKQMADDNKDRLIKEKDDVVFRLTKEKEEIIKLLEEKEDIIRLMKQKEDMFMSIKEKENKAELKITDEEAERSIKEKAEIARLMKEKEDGSNTILKLKKESETLRSSYEESCRLLESKKEDVARLLTDKENNDNIILELKKELEETKRLHEAHSQELETKAAKVRKELEQRIEEVKLMLDDSTKRRRELEELSESRIQFWKRKEVEVNQFVSLQVQNVQDLKLSSVSVRHEILSCQNKWSEELDGLGKSLKVVTNAAEKYHVALAENRKLFNEIQELKGNIRVYCRIRPFRPGEDDKSSSVEYIGDNGELVLSNPTKQGKEGGKNFTFNKVFGPTTTQDAVFKDIQPLIRSVLDGYNVCIFAYGQTGSGKTHTMMGPEKATEKEWGVNYRALNDLFNISNDRRDTITYELGVQMVEIYNEQIRDLLGSGGIQNTTQPNGLAVPDATMCPVTSTSHVIELMQTGHDNRAMSATALNERSSRSHSVVTIHVRGQDLKTGNTLRGALHLVDLAGSERVDRSAVTGDRLKEAQHINKSLAALGDVIFSLSQKNAHVPYRNSKLTQVLQTSLGGHAKTLMFVQVNPDVSSYTETLSTLKFAERVSGVELGAARTTKEGKEGKDVKELMDQLSLLKDTISKKDDEIDRLQLLNSSTRLKSARQTDPILKHSSSSPGITSLGKNTSVGSGAASDLDNFSDTSDRQSEAGSMLSVDPEVSGLGDLDSDGRLSDASDGGISIGAEADSSVNNVADQEQDKTTSAAKERLTKAVNRVQKLTLPKVGQSSSLRPKPRDPAPPRSSAPTGVRKSTTSQATPPTRTAATLKRGP